MQNWAAAKASPRCGVDAATTTETSPTSSRPTRCSRTSRPISANGARRRRATSRKPWHDVLLVGLVLERGHAGPTLGVVAHGAAEGHDPAALEGTTAQPPGVLDGERLVADGDPVRPSGVAIGWHELVLRHDATRWIGPAPSRSDGVGTPARSPMISAQIDTAVSSGVRAPMSMPIGAMICSIGRWRSLRRAGASTRPQWSFVSPWLRCSRPSYQCRNQSGNVELLVVGQNADAVLRPQRSATVSRWRWGQSATTSSASGKLVRVAKAARASQTVTWN